MSEWFRSRDVQNNYQGDGSSTELLPPCIKCTSHMSCIFIATLQRLAGSSREILALYFMESLTGAVFEPILTSTTVSALLGRGRGEQSFTHPKRCQDTIRMPMAGRHPEGLCASSGLSLAAVQTGPRGPWLTWWSVLILLALLVMLYGSI